MNETASQIRDVSPKTLLNKNYQILTLYNFISSFTSPRYKCVPLGVVVRTKE